MEVEIEHVIAYLSSHAAIAGTLARVVWTRYKRMRRDLDECIAKRARFEARMEMLEERVEKLDGGS